MITQNSTHTSPLYLLFLSGCVLTIGDILAGHVVKTMTLSLYTPVMMLYLLGLLLLIKSYEHEDIAVASTIVVVFNISILTIVGFFIFGETVTLTKLSGLLLGLFSVYLLETGKKVCLFEKIEK